MSQSSEELFGKARERLAGGVSHGPFQGPFPKYIERAEGSPERSTARSMSTTPWAVLHCFWVTRTRKSWLR